MFNENITFFGKNFTTEIKSVSSDQINRKWISGEKEIRVYSVKRISQFEAEKTALYVQRKMAFFKRWLKRCFLGMKRNKMHKRSKKMTKKQFFGHSRKDRPLCVRGASSVHPITKNNAVAR